MFCTSCGAELQPNAAFCSACGAAVAPDRAAPAAESAPVAVTATTAVAVTDVNTWAMWCHLSAIGGLVFPFGNVIGPLVVWLSKRDEIPEVDVNGKEALNFQLTMSGATIGIWLVSLFLMIASAVVLPREEGSLVTTIVSGVEGFSMLGIVAVWIVGVTQASMAARKGERYGYRYSLQLIK